MFCRVFCADVSGIDAYTICVEVDVSGGLPSFNMVGLPSSEVRESKERVERAIINSGYDFPSRRITVNLSPANVRKQGSGFDLPIALALLSCMGVVSENRIRDLMFVGELSLDGTVNKVRGVLPIAIKAREEGFRGLVVPEGNAFEGAAIEGIDIYGAVTLKELVESINKNTLTGIEHTDLSVLLKGAYEGNVLDYTDVRGQEKAKRATLAAVAGFHNLLYVGPPGSGKSMMASRIPTITNTMTEKECLELSKIYSVAGLLNDDSLMLNRPFRAPHQSITTPSLMGGGNNPKPGEITLAHKGVLFLDEISEFRREVIEDLRVPIENKKVVINRVYAQITFPCDFMLVMATNPCKCGYYPDRQHCRCNEAEVERYLSKIRGPILDRVDICVGVTKVPVDDLSAADDGLSSADMRIKILRAREIQAERFKNCDVDFNSQMSRKEVSRFCTLNNETRGLMDRAYEKYNMSARGYFKTLKVARTIADLEGEDTISAEHILEAIGYRNIYINQ